MIMEIWASFRRMPLWVQIWVAAILVPVNLAPMVFLSEPYAILIACLSVGGMIPNLVIMLAERGLSKRMALPHLVIWGPLVVVLGCLLAGGLVGASGGYLSMLLLLLMVDLISLGFDIPDAIKWLRGDRAIA